MSIEKNVNDEEMPLRMRKKATSVAFYENAQGMKTQRHIELIEAICIAPNNGHDSHFRRASSFID